MGREVKRISLDFQWDMNEVWTGFINPYLIDCPVCEGAASEGCCDYGIWVDHSEWCVHPDYAEACKGWTQIDPTPGDGWQLWETVSEGSPVSPVYKTLEELTDWMAANRYSGWAIQWVADGKTWLPSGMSIGNSLSFVQDH